MSNIKAIAPVLGFGLAVGFLFALSTKPTEAHAWGASSGGACSASATCEASSFTTTGTSTAATFTGTAASGSNAFAVSTNGARIDFGAGASDYCSSDGSTVSCASNWSWGNSQINAGVVRRAVDSQPMSIQSSVTNSDGTIAGVDLRRVTATTSHTAINLSVNNGSTKVAQVFGTSGALQMLGESDANRPACNSNAPGTAGGTRYTLYPSTTDNHLYFCNGTSWVQVTPP